MPAETKPPKSSKSETKSAENEKSVLSGITASISRIPAPMRRYGVVAIVVVLALLVIGVMRNFAAGVQQTRQEELRATAQALAMPTIESVTGGIAGAMMPSFTGAAAAFDEGIPRLASIDTIIPSRTRDDITTYVVAQGDNLFGIAERYGLKPESLLWFNFDVLEDNPNNLTIGQTLRIPPVDGVLHTYHTGESLVSIVEQYSYSSEPTAQDIIEWSGNHLDPYETDLENPNIPDGTLIIVPGGSRKLTDWGPPAVTRNNAASAAYYGAGHCGAIYEGALGYGSYVWPASAHYLSGFDYDPAIHPAIDIAGAEGSPVYAADSGVVVYSGWSDHGYGNLLVIDHGGAQSAYAHMSAVAVTCGQSVSQGEVVGAIGNTGNSSGAHLHFEINIGGFGKVNPWNYLPAG
jgi:murein DD-endopeptidase MepM/ murein hydrolase activator NlpD